MTKLSEYRDEELGAALRELDVPEHRPGFELPVGRRRRTHRAVPAVAAAGVAAAIAVVLVGLPHTHEALAARVQSRVAAALAQGQTISGRIVNRFLDVRTGRVRTSSVVFAQTARGDLRTESAEGLDVYDASTGIARSLNASAAIPGGPKFAAIRTGIAPGPPDGGPNVLFVQRQLASIVETMLAARDPRVREVAYRGRKAWRVELPVQPLVSIGDDVDRIDVTVDRELALPVQAVGLHDGAFRYEIRIDDLRVDQPLPAEEFTLRFPRGAEILHENDGFRRVALGDAGAFVGYAPLVPRSVPDGFGRAEVAVAQQSPAALATASNPPSRDVVSISYRRGFQQFVVTTRRRLGRHWHDPFGDQATGEHVVLHGGALDGVRAELVFDPHAIPHLWAETDKLVVTVGGDLTRSELLRVAESLD